MDFEEILNEWENKKEEIPDVSSVMEKWLEDHSVEEKPESEFSEKKRREAAIRRKKVREMPPQAEIDLHGLTAREAIDALRAFIKESKQKKFKKVLIIHGKGNHSAGDPVLKKEVRTFIEKCPTTGEFGIPDRYTGGSGALWVILR